MFDKLKKKGWQDHEISDLKERYSPKHESIFLLAIFFMLLLFAIIGVPYVYAIIGHLLIDQLFYLLLVLVGVPLGAVFGILLVEMYRLSRKHHIVLVTITPVLCIVATYAAISYATSTAPAGAFTHNALIGALVYGISFTAPYIFLVIQEWNSRIVFGNS